MNMFGVFGTTASVWNGDRLGDVHFVQNFQGVPNIDLLSVYVKK